MQPNATKCNQCITLEFRILLLNLGDYSYFLLFVYFLGTNLNVSVKKWIPFLPGATMGGILYTCWVITLIFWVLTLILPPLPLFPSPPLTCSVVGPWSNIATYVPILDHGPILEYMFQYWTKVQYLNMFQYWTMVQYWNMFQYWTMVQHPGTMFQDPGTGAGTRNIIIGWVTVKNIVPRPKYSNRRKKLDF